MLYLIEELNKCYIVYLYIFELDWVGGKFYLDVFCDVVCVCFKGVIIGVGVYIVEKVENLIEKGFIDVVVFGCSYIFNLDLVECL